MDLPASVLADLYFAGLLHDIGITSVPPGLLLKPEKLTEEEFASTLERLEFSSSHAFPEPVPARRR